MTTAEVKVGRWVVIYLGGGDELGPMGSAMVEGRKHYGRRLPCAGRGVMGVFGSLENASCFVDGFAAKPAVRHDIVSGDGMTGWEHPNHCMVAGVVLRGGDVLVEHTYFPPLPSDGYWKGEVGK